MLAPERAVEAGDGIQIGVVVEVGRRPQQRQLEPIDVVAALDERPAGVGECEIAADVQVVAQPVRAFDSNRAAGKEVVRTEKHALMVVILGREKECGAIVPAGDRERVLEGIPGPVPLMGMIENGTAVECRAPTPPANASARMVAVTWRRADSLRALTER